MNQDMQELTLDEAAAINGGDGSLARWLGYAIGYAAREIAGAFTTLPPSGDFNWARDK